MEFTDEDRRLITQHDVKLGILCARMDDIEDTMADGFQRILDKMDLQKDFCSDHREKIHGKYFSKKVLIPVLGLIILSMISLGVYIGDVSSAVDLNTYKVNDIAFKKVRSLNDLKDICKECAEKAEKVEGK